MWKWLPSFIKHEFIAMTNSALFPQHVGALDHCGDHALVSHEAPATLWFTGLSGSGKSTLASALAEQLINVGIKCCVIDGDILRQGINRDLGFSTADRHEAVRRAALLARSMNESGNIVLVSMISPLQSMRDQANAVISPYVFHEIYIATPLAVCEERDVKGLYRRARSGALPEFTGISSPYEAPKTPSLMINTDGELIEQSLVRLQSLFDLSTCRDNNPTS